MFVLAATTTDSIVPHGWHTPVRIAVILAVSVVVVAVVRRVVRRAINGIVTVRESDTVTAIAPVGTRSSARARTLTAVLVSTVTAIIWMIAVVTIFGELGLNLGAFIATATIIGGAIAFGAQNLVKDFLAGLYVLLEDQYGVGDIVDLGVASGTVQRVSLRTTRLRDEQGRVWYVPNGVVQRTGNLSQEWAQAVLDVPVALDVDLVQAKASLEDLAGQLAAEPAFAESVLEAPVVLGVQDVLDDRAVLRLVIKTSPAAQSSVMREMRERVLGAVRDGRLVIPQPVARTVVVRGEPAPVSPPAPE